MTNTEVIELTWGGRETAANAIEALQRGAKVQIALPANANHALFRRLYPEADASAPEAVDVEGGVELIGILSTLAGLEAMADLAQPLSLSGYRLQLRSPSPLLVLTPPQ